MQQLVQKIVNSFYLRNIVLCTVLIGASLARKVFMAGYVYWGGVVYSCIVFGVLYLLIVFHNVILYRKLLARRRYLFYILAMVGMLWLYDDGFLPPMMKLFGIEWEAESFTDKLLILYDYFVHVYIGFGLYLGFNYFKEREDKLKLEYLKRELELKQLKDQLNPHFLFNALNNIYSYSIENHQRSDELILKLSELMRFIIENAHKDSILVEEELRFIEHYIAFEQERLGNRCIIHFTKSIEADGVQVAPFILFTFIENAFKHGTRSTEQSTIHIELHVAGNHIHLSTLNPLTGIAKASTHTGLANTRRRLEIIYPHRHVLDLTEESGFFKTRLVIK